MLVTGTRLFSRYLLCDNTACTVHVFEHPWVPTRGRLARTLRIEVRQRPR